MTSTYSDNHHRNETGLLWKYGKPDSPTLPMTGVRLYATQTRSEV